MRIGCGEETYVNHLMAEHRRLDQLILRTLQAIPNWEESDVGGWPQSVVAGLAAIRRELAQHFAEEEAGGCLEEAVARCPALSTEADRVQGEHGRLLEVLDELARHCRQVRRPTRRDLLVLEHELRAVAQKLRLHEAEENSIMQRAFSVCLDNADAICDGAQPAEIHDQ